jgi:hypothetical protein
VGSLLKKMQRLSKYGIDAAGCPKMMTVGAKQG